MQGARTELRLNFTFPGGKNAFSSVVVSYCNYYILKRLQVHLVDADTNYQLNCSAWVGDTLYSVTKAFGPGTEPENISEFILKMSEVQNGLLLPNLLQNAYLL